MALTKYANNHNVSINLRDTFPYPYTREDAEYWLQRALRQDPECDFAIASREEAIGGIGLRLGEDVFRRTAEIGYWLGEPFWGRGIATRAVQVLTEYAFTDLDVVRVQAVVYEGNPASARVLEKAGYTGEGYMSKSITKEGKTIGHFLYAKVRE